MLSPLDRALCVSLGRGAHLYQNWSFGLSETYGAQTGWFVVVICCCTPFPTISVAPVAFPALRLQAEPLGRLKTVTPVADAAPRLQAQPLGGHKKCDPCRRCGSSARGRIVRCCFGAIPVAEAALQLQAAPFRGRKTVHFVAHAALGLVEGLLLVTRE